MALIHSTTVLLFRESFSFESAVGTPASLCFCRPCFLLLTSGRRLNKWASCKIGGGDFRPKARCRRAVLSCENSSCCRYRKWSPMLQQKALHPPPELFRGKLYRPASGICDNNATSMTDRQTPCSRMHTEPERTQKLVKAQPNVNQPS